MGRLPSWNGADNCEHALHDNRRKPRNWCYWVTQFFNRVFHFWTLFMNVFFVFFPSFFLNLFLHALFFDFVGTSNVSWCQGLTEFPKIYRTCTIHSIMEIFTLWLLTLKIFLTLPRWHCKCSFFLAIFVMFCPRDFWSCFFSACSHRWFFLREQAAWLDQDLSSVNRKEFPWVIVYGHRNFYCSNGNQEKLDTDCGVREKKEKFRRNSKCTQSLRIYFNKKRERWTAHTVYINFSFLVLVLRKLPPKFRRKDFEQVQSWFGLNRPQTQLRENVAHKTWLNSCKNLRESRCPSLHCQRSWRKSGRNVKGTPGKQWL